MSASATGARWAGATWAAARWAGARWAGVTWAGAKWGKDTVTFCDLNAVLYPQNAAWLLA